MKEVSFSIPQKVICEAGSVDKISEAAKEIGGKKACIISGPHLNKIGMVKKVSDALSEAGIESVSFTETEGNPSTDTVHRAAELFKACGADFIVAFGGGSPLDVAKAVAVVATYGGNITEYEGSGKVKGPVIPMIAIPTTAGTGSEVTAFSVITDHKRNYKLTVASNYILPKVVLVDPELITSVPAATAAACGIDALIHALEAYVSLASTSFSDMFAREALSLIGGNIRRYVKDRSDMEACEAMIMGSLYAGIAFSHARLGNVHAMSHPVSAFYDVAHGVANAILLPVVVDYNMREAGDKYFYIYDCIAESKISPEEFSPNMLGEELRILNRELGIPSKLSEVGVESANFDAMADDAMKSGNIKVNPRPTMKEDILMLYNMAY